MKKPTRLLSLVIMGSIGCGSAAAADTPKDAYDIDVACAAIAAASAVTPNVRRPASTDAAHDPADALMTLYDRRAHESGPRAGVAPAKVTQDIDALRDNIDARMKANNPSRAQTETADTAAMLNRCAALPVFETEDRLTHGH